MTAYQQRIQRKYEEIMARIEQEDKEGKIISEKESRNRLLDKVVLSSDRKASMSPKKKNKAKYELKP